MEFLDQNAPDPAEVSAWPVSLRYGLIWGAVSIAVGLIGYLAGIDPAMPEPNLLAQVSLGLVGLLVSIWAVRAAIKHHRDEELSGYLSLGRGVKIGALSGLVAGALGAVWMILYATVINPGFSESIREAQMAQYESQGMSEDQIEMAVNMAGWFTNPVFLGFSQLFGSLMTGLVLGLIIGAVFKRENSGR